MKKQLHKVSHDYLRYANCWEDADVLLKGLQVQSGDRVLSIGSAGDNSFSLLVDDPESVLAVDINPVQLALIELKKAAFLALDHDEFLGFLGFRSFGARGDLFEKVKTHLSKGLIQYWSGHLEELSNGIIHLGKFERYFHLFQSSVLPFIHSKRRIAEIFSPKDQEGQERFFQNRWNNGRWRMLFKVFFSKFVMGRFGRDPQFLKEVKVPVGEFISQKAQQHLSSVDCQQNYFLRYILTGEFGQQLPHYARKANFETIKARVSRLTVFKGLAGDALKKHSGYNRFNLSNIFEYMPPGLFRYVTQELVAHGETGARYAYWNLMVPRNMTTEAPQLHSDTQPSTTLTQSDKGFFYANVNFDQKS